MTIPADTTYKSQAGVPALTTPTAGQPDPRIDVVYLDVFLTEVDGVVDPELVNSLDIGMETSVRLKPAWVGTGRRRCCGSSRSGGARVLSVGTAAAAARPRRD